MRAKVTLTVQRVTLFDGPSLSSIVGHLKLPGKQACDLKNQGLSTWVDTTGALFNLKLEAIDDVQPRSDTECLPLPQQTLQEQPQSAP